MKTHLVSVLSSEERDLVTRLALQVTLSRGVGGDSPLSLSVQDVTQSRRTKMDCIRFMAITLYFT